MKPKKKWLRKPACNSSTSQEKAGFITYSTYECCMTGGFENHPLPPESGKMGARRSGFFSDLPKRPRALHFLGAILPAND
jgi:hypothetical protein